MDVPYSVGIYARVSVEDSRNSARVGSRHDESVSVENQRELLTNHALQMGWHIERVYTDDGYSGSTCDRPAFSEMIDDVKAKKINLVLVKDLSRFGRNYIEVGMYTDYLLPICGCRLVALSDNIDTGRDDNEMMPFRSLLNDHYLKDLSNKIKASHHAMAREGKRVAGRPPYGYRADPSDKHKFLIDDYPASVVRRIYEMRLQNHAYGKIAGILNSEGVLSPREYEYHVSGKEWPYKTRSVWLVKAIKDILKNESYLGHRVQLRQGTMSYRLPKIVKRPEDQWIRTENTHEPIVDLDTWNAVQAVNEKVRAEYKGGEPIPALFQGILRCADCGGLFSIIRSTCRYESGKTWSATYYQCTRYARSGYSSCSNHIIREEILKQILLDDIQKQARRVSIDRDKAAAEIMSRLSVADESYTAERIKRLNARLKELGQKQARLYEDKVSGIISPQTFTLLTQESETEREAAEVERSRLAEEQAESEKSTRGITEWMERITEYSGIHDVDRDLLEALVEHIEIGKPDKENDVTTQSVKIFYRHIGEL